MGFAAVGSAGWRPAAAGPGSASRRGSVGLRGSPDPTHVNRHPALLRDAIDLTKRGCFVDSDTVEQEPARWIQAYYKEDGSPERLTISSDAQTVDAEPGKLALCLASAIRDFGLALSEVLPAFTSNVARVLRLTDRGCLAAGGPADIAILDRESLPVVHVLANGRMLVRDGVCLL